mmetsp:Transcript_22715/g.48225  ORF Transcript_22715/g.48225 Transcript_22715/m.48225 type:complete len:238 (-) Transcript_22715:83-796(-)|eukprot:CAMPEP_0206497858 /NCGR_PEP_ID=MMETSP0324_2-20121206/50535_1 /ASSEMBLY_ACC=CAM_ASM_000836 /TAXON_ID=2866 /ORGANISM="Crypthecodinium cohnii, Strain Seligo" /LENGTH=237 /DNA_ID=CAMNT_0053983707 /DNA_START=48 /DNA_END=761 /DNA_ORIENTATION=-
MASGDLNWTATTKLKSQPKYSFGLKPEPKKKEGVHSPAPGDYRLVTTEKTRHKTTPQWGIGATQYRNKDRGHEQTPEPCSYTPTLSKSSSSQQRFSFGPGFGSTAPARFKDLKPSPVPAPGHYEVRKSCGDDGLACSVRWKIPEPGSGAVKPGPGHYSVSDKTLAGAPPRVVFGKSARPNPANETCAPAPGGYRLENMLEGGITKKSMPKFSMQGRPKEAAPKEPARDFFGAGSTFK